MGIKIGLLCLLLLTALLLSGCTGPSDKDIAMIGITGLPSLALLSSLAVFVLYQWNKKEEKAGEGWGVRKHMIMWGVITAISVTTVLLTTADYGKITMWELVKIPFELVGYIFMKGTILLIFLGPSAVLISMFIFEILRSKEKLKHSYTIPLIVSLSYFLLFINGVLKESIDDVSWAIIKWMVISWPAQIIGIIILAIYSHKKATNNKREFN